MLTALRKLIHQSSGGVSGGEVVEGGAVGDADAVVQGAQGGVQEVVVQVNGHWRVA